MARPAFASDEPAAGRARLTVEEDGVRRTVSLDGAATVGREPGCDVLLGSPTVSRRHALVFPDGEGWIVRDLGSGNGTFLDARRVDEARLADGMAIRFGSVPAWFEEEPPAPSRRARRSSGRSPRRSRSSPRGGPGRRPPSRSWRRECSSSSPPRSGIAAAWPGRPARPPRRPPPPVRPAEAGPSGPCRSGV